jgi:hypothetical protein
MSASPESLPALLHPRWERTEEPAEYFADEGRLRAAFLLLAAGGLAAVVLLACGLWRLRREVLTPPVFVGVCAGWVFTGPPHGADALRPGDFDRQFADTVEVLFGRTEKGLPPAIRDFCAPEVIAAIDRGYADAAARYPAGYVQTLTLLETKAILTRPGLRQVYYRGLLSSRSASDGQTSPVYLDCTFALAGATALNASGWRLVRVDSIGRDVFYRDEREAAERKALGLAPRP